jgi:hypothetical protein
MSSSIVLNLYRHMIRNARAIDDYNFRAYALRSVRGRFHANSRLSGQALESELALAGQEAARLQRIRSLTNSYTEPQSVMRNFQ